MRRFMPAARHMPRHHLFLAPYVQSLQALPGRTFAPTKAIWSRTTAPRLPARRRGRQGHPCECRIGGGPQPYLAFAALIAAGSPA
jgi:glutamine synthetase